MFWRGKECLIGKWVIDRISGARGIALREYRCGDVLIAWMNDEEPVTHYRAGIKLDPDQTDECDKVSQKGGTP